jgi:glycosyltransferase involved in cell wall biosynthesis
VISLVDGGRVLYVSSFDVSLPNGPGVNEREFVLAMSQLLGDRVRFLIPRPRYAVAELPVEKCRFCLSHRGHHPLAFWAHIVSQLRHAVAMLREAQFDLLVFRLDVLPFVQLYLSEKYDIPHVLKTLGQGPIEVFGRRGGWLGRMLKRPNAEVFRRIVSRSLVADTCSRLHVEYLQEALTLEDDHVVWIDNGVNMRRFSPASAREARASLGLEGFDPIVGYVGSRPWERGGMQIIEAAPTLLQKYPDLGLVILGDGKDIAGMAARADELGVRDRCRLDGFVPFEKVPTYVRSLDVGVSISLAKEREVSAELKVRQYLACGKPVIVSPGANEFVPEQELGSVVEPTDFTSVAAEIDNWLSMTPSDKEAFSERASRYMREHLSMDAMVARRLELWNERLNRPRG